MIQDQGTIRQSLKALALCLGSAVLFSCEMPPPGAGNEQPPSIEIAEPRPEQASNPDAVLGAMVHRIDMPLDARLEESWAYVDEQMAPLLTNGLWRVNGMRIGILHAENATAFAQSLPRIHGESRAKLYTSHYPTSVRSTPRLQNSVPVDVTVPPRSPTVYRARGGRLQLLVRIGRSDTGLVFVEATPHHFKPRVDLVPRSPLEKQLDGRVFRELAALLPITRDSAIVIGLDRPWPEAAPEPPSSSTPTAQPPAQTTDGGTETGDQADASETAGEPQPPETEPGAVEAGPAPAPAIPNGLGRSLMTTTRAGRPTQLLLIISMIEEDPSGDAQP